MGTIRKLTNYQLGSIGSTKVYSISSNETLYTLSSGMVAFEATNLGSYTVTYGQSNLALNSGGLLISQGSKFWDTVVDNFTMYFRASSAGITSAVCIQEYAGN